jgi:serine acetyltransferase
MGLATHLGTGISIHPKASIGERVTVGHCSCIGYGCPSHEDPGIRIGNDCQVGAFCVLAESVTLGNGVQLDHYCRIDPGARIGANSKILYGVQVFEDVTVGENCIIGGDLIDRMVVEDDVTFAGEPVHTHRDPSGDWDATIEPSPVIRRGSVVGVRALIIGGVSIGPNSFVGAGEVVRTDVPESMVLLNGQLKPLKDWRGFIKTRGG